MRTAVMSVLLVGLLLAGPSSGQVLVADRLQLSSHRPEAWAMAYLSAATLFHGHAAPLPPAGELRLGVALATIPRLSEAARRVGFDGTKPEDLNKSPLFGRLHARLGLPGASAVELGWTPPVEIDGARPRGHWALAIAREFASGDGWHASARAFFQRGEVRGDITCDRRAAALPLGSAGNPFGCREPSNDRFRIRSFGVELGVAAALPGDRLELHAGAMLSRLSARTQVDARVFGAIDRSLLLSDDMLGTLSAGAATRGGTGRRWSLALAWTPLDVRRPPHRERRSHDLWSLRVSVEHALGR